MSPSRTSASQVTLDWPGRWREATCSPTTLHLDSLIDPRRSPQQALDNRLVLSENLGALLSLVPSLEGQVDLIYADPPFFTHRTYRARTGQAEDSRQPRTWTTAPGYADRWDDMPSYLSMLEPRLVVLHHLLAPTGTLYLHLDWHAAPYVRCLLDSIFGPGRMLNEVVWTYHGPSPIRKAFSRKHDTILVYTKSSEYYFDAEAVRVPYDPATVRTFESSPKAGFGRVPDLARGKVPEDWWYFPVVARLHAERTGYPTQKPEALVSRIIEASCPPGGLVLDPYCGSGTAVVVALRSGRRAIGIDQSPLAVLVTYRRLLLEAAVPEFSLWNSRPFPPGPAPRMSLSASHPSEVTLKGYLGRPELPFPESLAVWEVDWDYDGQAFKPGSWAVRPWRSDLLPLKLGAGRHQTAGRIAVRLVTLDGRRSMSAVKGARRPGPEGRSETDAKRPPSRAVWREPQSGDSGDALC